MKRLPIAAVVLVGAMIFALGPARSTPAVAVSRSRAVTGGCDGYLLARSVVGIASNPAGTGYWVVSSAGRVVACGNAPDLGSLAVSPARPVVGIASTADGRGYWLVASDGGVFAFGDAGFFGSSGNLRLNEPVVGMASTAYGAGYWLVAADGGVFAFGDAVFHGSTGSVHLDQPVVGMTADPATGGYWLVASDGGVFAFDAPFLGSMGGEPLNQPVVGMTADPATGGYWLVASDGGVFSFGDAVFHGSTGSVHLDEPVVGTATDVATGGYWFVASDGGVFSFGAPFLGSAVAPLPSGQWTDPTLVVTPNSLGAVTTGLSLGQAQEAAGVAFDGAGDGFVYPTTLPSGYPHLYVGVGPDVTCVGAEIIGSGTSQTVSTPEGFVLGNSVQSLLAVYGSRAIYEPAPPIGGMTDNAGYVVSEPDGDLVFVVDPSGARIVEIAGGSNIGPNSCTG